MHARCARFRVRVTVRVKGEGLGLGLALWYGKKFARAHARCGRRRKMVDSQPPAAWRKRLRIIRSKDEATPFTACRWGFFFLVETRLPWGLLKKKEASIVRRA